MTPSQQIIANIYPEIEKLITDFYLVAADAARDEKNEDKEECLRYMVEKKVYPRGGNNWFWPENIYPIVNLDLVTIWFPSFEAAIEAFIQAWPKIRPNKQKSKDNIHSPSTPVDCSRCGNHLPRSYATIEHREICQDCLNAMNNMLQEIPTHNAEVDENPEMDGQLLRWVNGQLTINRPEDNPFR